MVKQHGKLKKVKQLARLVHRLLMKRTCLCLMNLCLSMTVNTLLKIAGKPKIKEFFATEMSEAYTFSKMKKDTVKY